MVSFYWVHKCSIYIIFIQLFGQISIFDHLKEFMFTYKK
jgi:hypothetical protein